MATTQQPRATTTRIPVKEFIVGSPESPMLLAQSPEEARRRVQSEPPRAAAIIDLTQIQKMPDRVNLAGPPQGFTEAQAQARSPREVVDAVPTTPGSPIELDLPDGEDAETVQAEAVLAPLQAVTYMPTLAAQHKPTRVSFKIPGGTFTVKYELVIIGNDGRCLVLGSKVDDGDVMGFEPDITETMVVAVSDGSSKIEYNVVSCGTSFQLDGWSFLVLPIRSSTGS